MNKNNRIIDNISVKNKLLLIYVLCIFIPVVFTNIIFINITSNNIKQQQIEQINASLTRTKVQLYKNLNDVSVVGYTIISDRKIKEALDKRYGSIEEFYQEYNDYLRDSLMKKNYLVNQISEVNIYTENKSILNSSDFIQINEEVKNNLWYKIAKDSSYKFHFGYYKENGEWKFSLLKTINDFEDGKGFNSILKINIEDTAIINSLNSEKITGEVYLVNEKNQIMYTTNRKYNNGNKELQIYDSKVLEKNDYEFKTNLEKYSDLKKWNLIVVANKSYITNAIQGPEKFIIFMGFIELLFSLTIIYIISSSFRIRLKILSKNINKVRRQEYEVIDCNEGRDEIGDVIKEFNTMALKIQELVRDVYEVNLQKKNIEIERRQAEINALQSQINPHFLFNVLESIRMRSLIKKENETSQIIKYVSKMFRRLLDWGNDTITVKEEMEYIEDFLKIQKYRFGDKIEYELNINEDVLNIMIPKMIFQPLVENSCVHGIEGKKNGGTVKVKAILENKKLICTISDNGTGIKEEKFSEIIKSLDRESEGKESIGIKNVYNRLKLIYGQDFKFEMVSNLEEGTSILIIIPAIIWG